jgi:opacity protein-like surface antigen
MRGLTYAYVHAIVAVVTAFAMETNSMTHTRLFKATWILCAFTCLTLMTAAPARAQGFISPLIGFDFGGDSHCAAVSNCEDKNLNVGVSLGVMGNVFGFEEELAFAKDFFGEAAGLDSNVLTLMSNAMLVPNLGPFRPYALAGVGLIKSHIELTPSDVLTSDNNHFGWDIGGGLMILFGDHVGVRGDIRYFHSFQDLEVLGISLGSDKLDYGRAAAAVVFKF